MTFPDLPQGLTSFGAALWDEALYIYGGHFGHAHEYYDEGQSPQLLRLNLTQPDAWEELPAGPRLQGLAMVAHGGMLYRIGGFAARNKKGADQDLWSESHVAGFDIAKGSWQSLAPLPDPRSSHDAVLVENRIYVAGGWQLMGGKESEFHKSAWMLDLSAESPQWQELPPPPFRRRALALGTLDGKVYVIGGMQDTGEPTTQVGIFDPQTNAWSEGPSLNGAAMEGFGPAACSCGGALYVSTYEGHLQRLTAGAESWETVRKLENPRFFHRMLCWGSNQLVMIGGASMETGKYKSVEVVSLES